MDLETENHLAALLMEEARRMRLQADKEGVGVYLHQPKVRGRPNARFLSATVLGVQQANRAVEVNEMWRAREKELDLDNRISHRSKAMSRHRGARRDADLSKESAILKNGKSDRDIYVSPSSSKQRHNEFYSDEDDGLRDEEVEEFLQSRRKRGRGAIGSRMDEPGPYPVCASSDQDEHPLIKRELRIRDERKGLVLGPEKPLWLTRTRHEEVSSGREPRKEVHSCRKAGKDDHAARSRERRPSEDKHNFKESSKKRKDKLSHHHRSRNG